MGLVGENGAGKSTLVKIIGGFDDGYSGEYTFDGEPVRFSNPSRAEKAGIAIAQQELSLIPAMSVAENIFLVGDTVPFFATKKSLALKAKPYLEEVGLDKVDPSISVNRLSIGEQQLVEVASLLAHDPRVLILDEPTAALGESDSVRILEMVERLATNGKSVIYVSHRLDEIFKICHRITVLRDGISQEPRKVSEFNVHSLVESMLGRELQNMFPERMKLTRSEPLLEVCGLWSDATVEPFNFQVYPGEILGLAGQLGSGSGDILSAIGGASGTREGKIKYKGREFLPKSPKEAIKASIAYCSNDRKLDGLFLGRPIKENLTSPALGRISTYGLLNQGSEERLAFGNAEKFTVDVTRMGTEAGLLSGGNQQKVALGKWLSIEPNIILVNEPTRGVDVGARAEIYGKLREFANEGKAVIFASTDIQEITGLSDRIITFYRGMQIGEIELKDISATKVLEQITHPFGVQQEVKTA
ncbi:MAG: sugar ABC transporter ATP-binding protein [Rhodobacteraceae bacterium]|nr:sugar ABC transporter ATP-binding protein [Paracoccaceae bacterium]MYG11047.1 sugar ABC transporter ATP-binding protein [Paracoccaceae bacterium]MYI90894.1 sugar ABC transporter ATP-binding protein [Paracoccaceae bacterium]MYJ87147.1 sugar ABC transporter ATP-binding protein [Paracoccaceae bacterium]